jgi:hypothetical protein
LRKLRVLPDDLAKGHIRPFAAIPARSGPVGRRQLLPFGVVAANPGNSYPFLEESGLTDHDGRRLTGRESGSVVVLDYSIIRKSTTRNLLDVPNSAKTGSSIFC